MIGRLASLALFAALSRPAAAEGVRLMSMDEVERRLGQPGFAVFDANVPELWRKHHLPGAVHLTGRNLERVLPADKDTRLVFYCTNTR